MSILWDPFTDDPPNEHDQCEEREDGPVDLGEVLAQAATDKAVLCVQGEKRRWVPRSQIHSVPAKGSTGPLSVSDWYARKWAADEDNVEDARAEVVDVPDVVCLQEARSGKAILVRVGGESGQEHWIPVSQLDPASEVKGDGDLGVLRISKWIATQKGLDR